MRNTKTKLVVVDDHPVVRESLAMLLGREPGLEVAASCGTADAGFRAVIDLAPDVVLMDIEMPVTSAFKVAGDLRKAGNPVRFVLLSAFLTDSNVQEILGLGGGGYLLKSAGIDEIALAIRTVATGGPHYAAEVQRRVSDEVDGLPSKPRSRLALLTTCEREVLRCVASDLSGEQIASLLDLSIRTVDRHRSNLMEKLAIHSQVGLTRFAVAEGLCDPRSPVSAPAPAGLSDPGEAADPSDVG